VDGGGGLRRTILAGIVPGIMLESGVQEGVFIVPIFEYQCAGCGVRFESLEARHDTPAPSCPACGGTRVQRVPSAFAVARPADQPAAGPCGSQDCACRQAS
jgi:putative FmdB family regulatory protein